MKKVVVCIALLFSFSIFIQNSHAETYHVSAAKKKKKKVSVALKKKGFGAIPSTTKVFAKKKEKSNSFSVLDTSGTPPLLVDIPESDVGSIFWRSIDDVNVLDDINSGTPSAQSCNEFFGGNNDDESGGLAACYLTQNVGFAMENILSSAGSLCYMQKMPKAPAGVEIVSGAAPDNDPTKLFAPPAGATDRLVKVVVSNFPGEEQGDQKIFIRIFAQDTNADAGNAYKHLIYFCSGNDANPNGYEQTTIKPNGNYEGFNLGSDEQGDYEATITAKLITQGNKLSFDPNSKRQAEVASVNDQSKFFKSFLEIANNKIKNKNLDSFGSDVRKAYNVARYSGANIQTLRFVEGGVKDDNFQAITEFRGTSYRAAPENTEFNQDLNAVDLDTDSFYLSSPSVDTSDLATFDCAAEADVVVTMDMGNEQLQEFVADCEGQRLNGMNFCNEDSDISNAEQNFNSACFQN